jgi:hypothetical protein
MKARTLQLHFPFGQTLLLVGMILLLFALAGEGITRTDTFQAKFARPTWGSRHIHLELQLDRLNHIVNQDGPVDCIFLGNSMVINGIDPITFANAYRNETGHDMRCFNFGVDGLSPVGASALAEILIEDYQPDLLVFGTDARDYAVGPEDGYARLVFETPWIQYRLGKISITGWLFDMSSLLRYRRPLRMLLRFDLQRALWERDNPTQSNKYGYSEDPRISEFVNEPPDPDSELTHVQYYFNTLSNYKILPEHLNALEDIARLADTTDTKVLILEMPIPSTYLYFFGDGVNDYQNFLDSVGNIAREYDLSFWTTTNENLIPNYGWADYSHLNTEGAKIFSEWLGEQVGEAVKAGSLILPSAHDDLSH